jgi:uncharacterized membrane protein YeaQ/YmgE (transglycosylase-associated protein family)
MNSLIVISWVSMGVFVAWIETHLVKDPSLSHSSGVGNLAVSVLGALLGGLLTHSLVHGRQTYAAFTICAAGAVLAAALFLAVTRLGPRRRGYASGRRERAHVSSQSIP